jgi:hypothetical protein
VVGDQTGSKDSKLGTRNLGYKEEADEQGLCITCWCHMTPCRTRLRKIERYAADYESIAPRLSKYVCGQACREA